MFEFIKDSSLVLIRIITILPLILFTTLYMGKRTIGEIPIFDFLVILILGSVVGADIADPNIKHLPTVVAIIGIAILQRIIANLKITNRKIGRLITFEPTVVVQNGKLLNKNLKKIRYSIDNILQLLREKDIFDINDVETALIESSGNLSVLKKPRKNTVTLEDMKLVKKNSSIAYPIIIEGEICSDLLSYFNLSEAWLHEKLRYQEITDIKDIFFASINEQHELHISLKNENISNIPIIKH
ncbi:DUF421 domain-containing protein [Cellulosilyticum sp. I15G10I2]|uniref:DUF421 domain-containing protein n=1 Tax=Cellulosilyticum sp. I15G10I2 TaxID=1892843 RepID=UPI00085C2018|nr:DUF421 domain-containing protein [Cellulosilyticum sp. I15G10I2]